LAGLREVPVVIGSSAHDVYAQVAENQKRHVLSPLDLAKFMRSRVDAGESNAEIARRMGIDASHMSDSIQTSCAGSLEGVPLRVAIEVSIGQSLVSCRVRDFM
jgi:ParB-like chromosome segregation protein Spo0J